MESGFEGKLPESRKMNLETVSVVQVGENVVQTHDSPIGDEEEANSMREG